MKCGSSAVGTPTGASRRARRHRASSHRRSRLPTASAAAFVTWLKLRQRRAAQQRLELISHVLAAHVGARCGVRQREAVDDGDGARNALPYIKAQPRRPPRRVEREVRRRAQHQARHTARLKERLGEALAVAPRVERRLRQEQRLRRKLSAQH